VGTVFTIAFGKAMPIFGTSQKWHAIAMMALLTNWEYAI
jgi:hypothetical protein